ncbi:MAG: transcriptional regulator, TetR family [Ilumatobacteraceae bacterium]|nr:transcriptional regulator, TetR family [Ilumatobacteraceae bacterium]
MPTQPNSDLDIGPRERLIEAAVAHAAAHGLGDTSLRQLALALGTSHRMLIHHFGSKEGLLVEVVRRVERQQRVVLDELRAGLDPGAEGATAELGSRFWESLTDPAVQQHERLFFEVYGQALQGRAWAMPMLDGIVDDWVGPMAELLEAHGGSPTTSRVDARLAVAVARGLLLDLLATGEDAAVGAAMARFEELLTNMVAR